VDPYQERFKNAPGSDFALISLPSHGSPMQKIYSIGEHRVLVRSQKEVLQNDKVCELFELFSTETRQASLACDLELLCDSDLLRTLHETALLTLKTETIRASERSWVATLDTQTPYKKCRVVTTESHICEAFQGALGLFLSHNLKDSGGWFLHSSGILVDNRAFLFLGKSGSGKTTVALRAHHEGLALLSDDKVYFSRSSSIYTAYGTPLGKISDGPISGPVAGAFFLRQGDKTSFHPLSASVATAQAWFDTLYNSRVANPHVRKRIFEEWFSFFSSVPCYEMQFTRDFDDWDKLLELTAHE